MDEGCDRPQKLPQRSGSNRQYLESIGCRVFARTTRPPHHMAEHHATPTEHTHTYTYTHTPGGCPLSCDANPDQKAASDYDTGGDGGEHKLHSGKWDWHSYVLKGRRQEAFREHCPVTAVR